MLTEVRKTPLEIKFKFPVCIGELSVPHQTRSGNMVMRQTMQGVAEKLVKVSSEPLVIKLVRAQISPMRS